MQRNQRNLESSPVVQSLVQMNIPTQPTRKGFECRLELDLICICEGNLQSYKRVNSYSDTETTLSRGRFDKDKKM